MARAVWALHERERRQVRGEKNGRPRSRSGAAEKEMRNTLDNKNYIMNGPCEIAETQLGIRLSIDEITGLPYFPVNERIEIDPKINDILVCILDSFVSPFALSEDPEDIRKKRELLLNDFSRFADVFDPSVFRDFLISEPDPLDVYKQEIRGSGEGVAPFLLTTEGYYVALAEWKDSFLEEFDTESGMLRPEFVNDTIARITKFAYLVGLHYDAEEIEQCRTRIVEFADTYAEDLYVNDVVDLNAVFKTVPGGWDAEKETLRTVLKPHFERAEREAKSITPREMIARIRRHKEPSQTKTLEHVCTQYKYRREPRSLRRPAVNNSRSRCPSHTAAGASSSGDSSGGEPPSSDPDLPRPRDRRLTPSAVPFRDGASQVSFNEKLILHTQMAACEFSALLLVYALSQIVGGCSR